MCLIFVAMLTFSTSLTFRSALITVPIVVSVPTLHMPIAALLVLRLPSLALRGRFPAISAFRLLVLPIIRTRLVLWPCLLLRSRLVLPILVTVLLLSVRPSIVWPSIVLSSVILSIVSLSIVLMLILG